MLKVAGGVVIGGCVLIAGWLGLNAGLQALASRTAYQRMTHDCQIDVQIAHANIESTRGRIGQVEDATRRFVAGAGEPLGRLRADLDRQHTELREIETRCEPQWWQW
jgi:hypothetical protein